MNENKTETIITIFLGWLGVHKFMQNELVLGLIYLFTFGLFGIGWIYDIYTCFYYNSESFKKIKDSIKDNIQKCNEFNEHIEELKNSYVDIKKMIMVQLIIPIIVNGILKDLQCKSIKSQITFIIVLELYVAMQIISHLNIFANILILNLMKKI